MTTLVEKSGSSRSVVGYCWPWTVRSGEQVDFCVSCENGADFSANLVRILCADNLSSLEMFKEQALEASFDGSYPGRLQRTHLGSYVEIIPTAGLDRLSSFTVQAMVYPTLLPGGVRIRHGGIANSGEDHVFHDQHLISRWDEPTQRGWALLIDSAGYPSFIVGDSDGVRRITLGCALAQDRWFLVVGGVNARTCKLHIAVRPIARSAGDVVAWPEQCLEESYSSLHPIPQQGPLRFGACTAGPSNGSRLKATCCFNGRLDRVRMSSGVVNLKEAVWLAGTSVPKVLEARVIGFWDFARDIDKIEITDLSVNALHGETVNVPTRAVTGVDWDGSGDDWRARPQHYSAIHFHEDDLYDAEWDTDFSYTIPQDLPSGIYAARLRHGDSEDYVPFFVAPPKGVAQAAVALLLPTASYTAYTNVTGLTTLKRKRETMGDSGKKVLVEEDLHPDLLQDAADAAFLLKHHRRLGKGIYSNHTDGTLASCASQRHPNMTTKPKGINWTLVADTYIVDWLEQKKIPYDVITDDLLHEEGAELLALYTVVLTGSHPEYYTRRMLDAVNEYQRAGGRWMYLGGNGFYYVTSAHAQLPGLIEVRKGIYAGHFPPYERRHAFDGEYGGKWEDNGRSPALLVGLNYNFDNNYAMEGGAPYKRLPGSYASRAAFIFDGVSGESIGHFGLFGNGAAGQEVDTKDPERGTPAHALHLARADTFPQHGSLVAEQYKSNARGPIADMLFFETPNGGAVFSVGSMSWAGALSHSEYDNDVSRITENVLRRFTDREPFTLDAGQRSVPD
jgi:N,N-dimethylformamidase